MAKLIEMKFPHGLGKSRLRAADCAESVRNFKRNVISVMSMTGGAGKTSLVVNLGRVLERQRRRVFLMDTAPHGLLPFHLGASETGPGQVRDLSNAGQGTLRVMNLDIASGYSPSADHAWLKSVLLQETEPSEYVLVDINTAPLWLTRQILQMSQYVLIPLMPDMSTLLSIPCIEDCLDAFSAPGIDRPSYFAVLNQFDSEIAFHRRVETEAKAHLGRRLVPVTLSRDARMSCSLPQERNWMERYPTSPLVQDYLRLSLWVQRQLEGPAREVADL
jgi:cellulose biosynthesis protein BcsQ